MNDSNWIYMLERMQNIRKFSRTIIQRGTKDYEIPAEHLDLLSHLVISEEKITPMVLSKVMRLNKTIISRIIEQLSNKGYVIKVADNKDKRSYSLSITHSGEAELKRIYNHYLGPIYELKRKLGDEEFFKLMSSIENANIKFNEQKEGVKN